MFCVASKSELFLNRRDQVTRKKNSKFPEQQGQSVNLTQQRLQLAQIPFVLVVTI